jgi:Fe-S cluster biosynthesis and repair protein YggX
MLNSFDGLVVYELGKRRRLLDGTFEQEYIQYPELYRNRAFQTLSEKLWTAYGQRVIVLIDEYNSPMHVAIENGYANSVWSYFIPSPFETHLIPGQLFL